MVKITDDLGSTIIRATTGRSVSSRTPEEKRLDALAAEWFSQCSEAQFRAHDAALEFAEAAQSASRAAGKINCFRGRLFYTGPVTDPLEFGPPPSLVAAHGRYNPKGQAVLYLATTVSGVTAELARHRNERAHLFCQLFSVDLDALRVADLTDAATALFQICFDYSECEKDPAKYFRSQVLAELIAMAGFEGFLVPGARGSKENRYHNLVLFRPCAHWRHWVDGSSLPRLVEE